MNRSGLFDFKSFPGEHPYAAILLVPWNYSPCIIVAASWCLTHSTNVTLPYFKNISIKNPYKVITGIVNTNQQDTSKIQITLGIKAVLFPNPTVVFAMIKVIPEFKTTLFVDYRMLKYNTNIPVNEICESFYWTMIKHKGSIKNYYYFEYQLMNQIPFPFEYCHSSNEVYCKMQFKEAKVQPNSVSSTILCNNHFMSFAEFNDKGGLSVFYHKITRKVITWIKNYITHTFQNYDEL